MWRRPAATIKSSKKALCHINSVYAMMLACLCVSGAALGIVTAGAGASVKHAYEPALSAKLSETLSSAPSRMAIDSGRLWAFNGAQIDEFGASTGGLLASPLTAPSFRNSFGFAVGGGRVYVGGDEQSGEAEGRVAVLSETGTLQSEWTGANTPHGSFGEREAVDGLAVDDSADPGDWASGDVYVAAQNRSEKNGIGDDDSELDVIKPTPGGGEGELVAHLAGPEPGVQFVFGYNQTDVAVNQSNGDVIVVSGGEYEVNGKVLNKPFELYGFEPAPAMPGVYNRIFTIAGTTAGAFGAIDGVAVDSGNGEIYAWEGTEVGTSQGRIDQFSASGAFLGAMSGPEGDIATANSVSVDPESHYVYVANQASNGVAVFGPDLVIPDVAVTEPPLKLTPTGVTLRGTVNPENGGEASCEFEYGTTTGYGQRAKCQSTIANGNSPLPVESEPITGLTPDTTYHYRLDAANSNKVTNTGEGAEDLGEFHTPGAAANQQGSAKVSAEAATLEARIEPNGSPTTYYFQYGTSTSYGAEAPAAPGAAIGSGHGTVEVEQRIGGLQPNTIYHYRVVAVSELSLEVSPGRFETQIQSFYGSDETLTTTRTEQPFELPDHREWEMVTPPQEEGALLYPLDPSKDGKALFGLIQAAAGGEAIVDLATRPTETEPEGYSNEVNVLSVRTGSGWSSRVLDVPHASATSTSVAESNEYRFFTPDLSQGIVQQFGEAFALSPEATEETPYIHLNYQPSDSGQFCAGPSCYHPLVTAGNAPAGAKFGEAGAFSGGECDLLCGPQFIDATPSLSNIIIESDVPLTTPAGGEGFYDWSNGELQPLYALPAGEGGGVAHPGLLSRTDNQLADDGRVFFTYNSHVYVQDFAKRDTFRLDLAQGVAEPSQAGAQFLYASPDGSTAFFSDSQQLTSSAGGGIYACRIVEEAGGLGCQLSLLPDPSADEVVGVSEDGSHVYLAGSNGVDVVHFDEGEWIATGTPMRSVSPPSLASSTRVSSNGLWLAFASTEDLTGYDPRNQVNNASDEEVYLYSAESNQLRCVSCNPTGERPAGLRAGWLPPWLYRNAAGLAFDGNQGLPVSQPRFLTDSGQVFFNSAEALVLQDVNGANDVYEYEPPGVGTCSASSPTYGERAGGCVGLISSGNSAEESSFLDASENGSDVFFLTEAKLVPLAVEATPSVYDARECVPSSRCLPPQLAQTPPCSTGDSCKPPQSPQPTLLGAPATETFSGPGDIAIETPLATGKSKAARQMSKLKRELLSCRRRHRGRRGKKARLACETAVRRRYSSKSSKTAKHGHGRAR